MKGGAGCVVTSPTFIASVANAGIGDDFVRIIPSPPPPVRQGLLLNFVVVIACVWFFVAGGANVFVKGQTEPLLSQQICQVALA